MIGNSNWSSQLTEALVEYHENNHISKIQVHKAHSVKSALSTLSNVYADLVIILLDISKNDCLVDVSKNLFYFPISNNHNNNRTNICLFIIIDRS